MRGPRVLPVASGPLPITAARELLSQIANPWKMHSDGQELTFRAELIEHGDDFHAADHHADDLARERALFRMPSFDLLLVRGVASYALELFRGIPAVTVVDITPSLMDTIGRAGRISREMF